MSQIITFTNVLGVPEEYLPIPASKIIPEWYKDLESYITGEKGTDGMASTNATAKRCMPIFDSICMGYIICTHVDLFISQREDEDGIVKPFYEWANFSAISFHQKAQLPDHPNVKDHNFSYPKWINAWSIKTPPGYSTLFIPPLHRETPINIFSGVVDTDTYHSPVNFPFVLKDTKMQGLIPAGTPIAQIIPFKRDDWEIKVGDIEDFKSQQNVTVKLRTRIFDSYKNQFRKIKTYK